MSEAFREGGWPMFPILLFGLLTIAAAVRYAWSPERRHVPLVKALSVVTLLGGVTGFVLGLICTLHAVGQVPADQRYIVLIGLGESLNDIALALMLVLVAGLVTALGAWRASGGGQTGATVPIP